MASSSTNCSAIIDIEREIHEIHKRDFIQVSGVFCVALLIAKKAMIKKTKSMAIHQNGVEAQQLLEQEEAINKIGVAMQCIKHKKLAVAPIQSDFSFKAVCIMLAV